MYRNLAFGRELDSLDVVLVDEHRGMRSLLATILKSHRIARLRLYGDSNRALSDMAEMTPDVVILQWNMEKGDPVTLLRTLRAETMRPLCFVPVIVLSSLVSKGVVTEAVRAGGGGIAERRRAGRARWVIESLASRYGSYGLERLGGRSAVEARLADADSGYAALAALGSEVEEALGKPR